MISLLRDVLARDYFEGDPLDDDGWVLAGATSNVREDQVGAFGAWVLEDARGLNARSIQVVDIKGLHDDFVVELDIEVGLRTSLIAMSAEA